MTTLSYHLAQINAAPLLAPIDDPQIADFANAIAQINALAEQADGFVWRLVSDEGEDATGIRIDDDPLVIVNMSVWESMDALYKYVYNSNHAQFFARRREWFRKWDKPSPVMWWIPVGTMPTLEEAIERIDYMALNGPTPYAFNFKQRFTPEEASAYVIAD
jgi:heme-degrading monooxygenase HmoA